MSCILYYADCLQLIPTLLKQSVHAVITDLPYGSTKCKWDDVIPFSALWQIVSHILPPDRVFVTTGSQPFTSMLIASNISGFRYEWVWQKNKGSNFAVVKYQPFKEHENILVFSEKRSSVYNPQKRKRSESGKSRLQYHLESERGVNPITGLATKTRPQDPQFKNPGSVLYFNCQSGLHPTQKPLDLYKYLVKTYTNPGETVLDLCMGSGTTGEASLELGRNFIGIDKDEQSFLTAQERLKVYL